MAGKWVALILVAGITQAQAEIPEGTYSNVCMHPETGDLLGAQLEIRYSNGKPDVLLWICEGECGRPLITGKITINGNQLAFTGAEKGISYPSGKPVLTTLGRFTATLRGTGIVLANPPNEPKQQILPRRIKPTGDPKAEPMVLGRCN
jgi:hypothetical protein